MITLQQANQLTAEKTMHLNEGRLHVDDKKRLCCGERVIGKAELGSREALEEQVNEYLHPAAPDDETEESPEA